jgi:hypothetical protein
MEVGGCDERKGWLGQTVEKVPGLAAEPDHRGQSGQRQDWTRPGSQRWALRRNFMLEVATASNAKFFAGT